MNLSMNHVPNRIGHTGFWTTPNIMRKQLLPIETCNKIVPTTLMYCLVVHVSHGLSSGRNDGSQSGLTRSSRRNLGLEPVFKEAIDRSQALRGYSKTNDDFLALFRIQVDAIGFLKCTDLYMLFLEYFSVFVLFHLWRRPVFAIPFTWWDSFIILVFRQDLVFTLHPLGRG